MIKQDWAPTIIQADSVDDLVLRGILHVKGTGRKIRPRAGNARQSFNLVFILNNSRNRIQYARYPETLIYLCRETIAYFRGSNQINDGLSDASSFWKKIADPMGRINSNYGYYVFYERVARFGSQFNWVVEMLSKNPDSRRAIININNCDHKEEENPDFPCCVSLQFFVWNRKLFCDVMSRSEDLIYGLPYDIGFFSILNEMVWKSLIEKGVCRIGLGPTQVRASFCQLYDRNQDQVEAIETWGREGLQTKMGFTKHRMPRIDSAEKLLNDIYTRKTDTRFMKWLYENSDLST